MSTWIAASIFLALSSANVDIGTESRSELSQKVDYPTWIHFDGSWIDVPEGIGPPGMRSAPATVVEFEGNGHFLMVQCWINDFRNGQYRISGGDPYRLFVGSWTEENNQRHVKFKLQRVSHTELPDDATGEWNVDVVVGSDKMQFWNGEYEILHGVIVNLSDFTSQISQE
jgi:hypothetical protein